MAKALKKKPGRAKKRSTVVKAKYLAMLAPFCSRDDGRPYLQGVYVQPHPTRAGALLVATDGHRMVVAHDKDGAVAEPAIYPISKTIARAVQKKAAPDYNAFLHDGSIGLQASGAPKIIEDCQPIYGTYPDWWRVFTRKPYQSAAGWAFNPDYLRDFRAIDSSVVIYNTGASAPAIIRFGKRPEIIGLLMPVGAFDAEPLNGKLPHWFPAERKLKQKTAA